MLTYGIETYLILRRMFTDEELKQFDMDDIIENAYNRLMIAYDKIYSHIKKARHAGIYYTLLPNGKITKLEATNIIAELALENNLEQIGHILELCLYQGVKLDDSFLAGLNGFVANNGKDVPGKLLDLMQLLLDKEQLRSIAFEHLKESRALEAYAYYKLSGADDKIFVSMVVDLLLLDNIGYGIGRFFDTFSIIMDEGIIIDKSKLEYIANYFLSKETRPGSKEYHYTDALATYVILRDKDGIKEVMSKIREEINLQAKEEKERFARRR